MKYILVIKSNNEAISKIKADNHDEAYEFFIQRKQMDKKAFNSIYEVKKDEE